MHILLQQNVLAHYRHGLVRELARLPGLRLTIVSSSTSDTPFLETTRPEAIPEVHFIDSPVRIWRFASLRVTLSWQFGALRALALKPDVIVAMGSPYSLTAWALVLAGRMKRIPVLLWTHGLLDAEAGIKWRVRATLFRWASGLLLYGDRAKPLLLAGGIPPESLHVIYNSLDVDEQQRQYERALAMDPTQLRSNWNLGDSDRVIIFTGRLEKRKAIDRIIEAIALLKKGHRKVHFLLIGHGSLRSELEDQSRVLGVSERVHFCGAVHAEARLAEAFRISDLCVIPSGPGLTVLHSLIYGVPVLTTRQNSDQFPEAEAVVPGQTGFLCDTSSAVTLAAELDQILYPHSPRSTMEHMCRRMVLDKFTPQEQARRIKEAVTCPPKPKP